MSKLILSERRVEPVQVDPDVKAKLVRIKARRGDTYLIGGGLIFGSLIMCPASILNNRSNVLVEYFTEYHGKIETWGCRIDDDHVYGLATLCVGYVPRTASIVASIASNHEVMKLVQHSANAEWESISVRVDKIVTKFFTSADIGDPMKHPGSIGGLVFDSFDRLAGIVDGRSNGSAGNIYVTPITTMCSYMSSLEYQGIILTG